MSLAQRMLAAFEGSKVTHGTTKVGKVGRNGKAEADSRIVREPLTQKIMKGHIDGKQGIGAIPINEDNKCRWGRVGYRYLRSRSERTASADSEA